MMFKAPKKASKYQKEPKPDKYILPFAPELVNFILEKRKMKTYRFGLKYDYLKVGDEIGIQNYGSKEIVARAKITSKRRTTFRKIPIQIEGHGTYCDKKHQRKVFSGYYAYIGRVIKDEDIFLMIGFELIR